MPSPRKQSSTKSPSSKQPPKKAAPPKKQPAKKAAPSRKPPAKKAAPAKSTGKKTTTSKEGKARSSNVVEAAAALAQRIFLGTLEDAEKAVSEAFAWVGVPTSWRNQELRRAVAPVAPARLMPFEAYMLAVDARSRRKHTTVGQLEKRLLTMAERLNPKQATRKGKTSLATALRLAAEEAEQNPKNVHGFAPAFLQVAALMKMTEEEGAQALDQLFASGMQGSGAAGGPSAEAGQLSLLGPDSPLSMLETQLLLASLLREGDTPDGGSGYDPVAGPAQPVGGTPPSWEDPVDPRAPDRDAGTGIDTSGLATACSSLHDMMGDLSPVGDLIIDARTDRLLEKHWDSLFEDAGVARSFTSKVFKYLKLWFLVDGTLVRLDATFDNPEIHRSTDPRRLKQSTLTVRVSVNPEYEKMFNDFSSALADCLSASGLEHPLEPPASLREQMENWSVRWKLRTPFEKHARFAVQDYDFNGPLGHRLEVSDGVGQASVRLESLLEPSERHMRNAPVIRTGVPIDITLDMSDLSGIAPTLILQTAFGDLWGSLEDLAIDGAKTSGMQHTAVLTVMACSSRWSGTVVLEEEEVWKQAGGTMTSRMEITYRLQPNGKATYTGTYRWELKVAGSVKAPLGTVKHSGNFETQGNGQGETSLELRLQEDEGLFTLVLGPASFMLRQRHAMSGTATDIFTGGDLAGQMPSETYEYPGREYEGKLGPDAKVLRGSSRPVRMQTDGGQSSTSTLRWNLERE